MVEHHETDTKFDFLAHLAQMVYRSRKLAYFTNDWHFCILKMKFMETSNTKDVCIHANNTPVKFRGKSSTFNFLAYSAPM